MVVFHDSLRLPALLAVGIPPSHAHVLSLLFTSTYVGSIYLSQVLFPGRAGKQTSIRPDAVTGDSLSRSGYEPEVGSRNHPETIKKRIKAVGGATLLSLGGVFWVTKKTGKWNWTQAIHPTLTLLGLSSISGRWMGYVLPPILFSGPLVAEYLDGDLWFQKMDLSSSDGWMGWLRGGLGSVGWIEIRNYLVGPLTEELVFRSTILSVSLLGGLTPRELIFGTPLWFGLAHIHHAIEVWKTGGKTRKAAIQALAGCVFQLGYTTLFGWFASYLFLRTGSIFPSLVAHMFCNKMGIYLPMDAVARHPRNRLLIWSSYALGIVGFVYGLRAL